MQSLFDSRIYFGDISINSGLAAWIAIFSVPSRFRQKYNSEPTYNDCKQRFQLLAVIFLRPKETSYGDEV